MSVKANKAVIGLFVLGAVFLAVAGVVLFGSGKLFSPTKKYVMYFDGSVKGLSDGAPVVFRGVKIGSIVDIILQGNLHDMTFTVPVIAEIDLGRFQITGGPTASVDYDNALIEHGLRAQLQTQSLLTGQLMIDIDFRPDRPARMLPDTTGYPQIPTIPSATDVLVKKLEELPIQQLVERANALVGGLDRLVNSSDMQNAPRNLNLAVDDARKLFEKIDRDIRPLSAELRKAIGEATVTINHLNKILAFEEGPPAELLHNLNQALSEARTSLRKFDETLDSVRNSATDERSYYQLRHTLKELGETSRALGSLVDYLDRHPEALLRGKENSEEK